MDKRLQGKFMGCPYHDDDYEACIEYSGRAPCDPPDGWRLVPSQLTPEMWDAANAAYQSPAAMYHAMLSAAPKRGEQDD